MLRLAILQPSEPIEYNSVTDETILTIRRQKYTVKPASRAKTARQSYFKLDRNDR